MLSSEVIRHYVVKLSTEARTNMAVEFTERMKAIARGDDPDVVAVPDAPA